MLVLAALGHGIFLRSQNAITSEADANTSCQQALVSHLADMRQESPNWALSEVSYDPSVDRWLCSFDKPGEKKTYVILKPKSGGFEVTN